MTTTLLLSTYNWVEALELVLLSITKQSENPDLIVIADDGSKKETKDLIESYKKKINIPITHIWQEDNGFRKTSVLNKAIKSISTDYIIQIDGDIILHKHFIKDHINNAEKGCFLFGSRISINQLFSKKVLSEKIIKFSWFNNSLQRKNRMIRLPFLSQFRKPENKNSRKLRGCNISYHKADAIAINGYNEDFVGWGYEDYEFAQRLLNYGLKAKRLKQIAIQFHIYHNEAPKGNTEIGDSILIKTMEDKITKCKNGIEKLQ